MSRKVNMKMLRMASNEMAIRFISPMYLVGSYLTDPRNAKDIDLLMVVTNDRYERLFGDANDKNHIKRIFNFRKKQKLYFELYIRDMDIDFKVVTLEGLQAVDKKRLKLDTYMEFPE